MNTQKLDQLSAQYREALVKEAAARKAYEDAKYEWEKANSALINDHSSAATDVALAEEELREAIIEYEKRTNDTPPQLFLGIQQRKQLSITDQNAVVRALIQNPDLALSVLKIDEKKLLKLIDLLNELKAVTPLTDLVKITTNPTATISKPKLLNWTPPAPPVHEMKSGNESQKYYRLSHSQYMQVFESLAEYVLTHVGQNDKVNTSQLLRASELLDFFSVFDKFNVNDTNLQAKRNISVELRNVKAKQFVDNPHSVATNQVVMLLCDPNNDNDDISVSCLGGERFIVKRRASTNGRIAQSLAEAQDYVEILLDNLDTIPSLQTVEDQGKDEPPF